MRRVYTAQAGLCTCGREWQTCPRTAAKGSPRGKYIVLSLLLAFLAIGAAAQRPRAGATNPPAVAAHDLLDVNTASPAALRALPGMGDAYVRRVIENRPYSAKNQLFTRGILPQAAYERIRDLIVAHRLAPGNHI